MNSVSTNPTDPNQHLLLFRGKKPGQFKIQKDSFLKQNQKEVQRSQKTNLLQSLMKPSSTQMPEAMKHITAFLGHLAKDKHDKDKLQSLSTQLENIAKKMPQHMSAVTQSLLAVYQKSPESITQATQFLTHMAKKSPESLLVSTHLLKSVSEQTPEFLPSIISLLNKISNQSSKTLATLTTALAKTAQSSPNALLLLTSTLSQLVHSKGISDAGLKTAAKLITQLTAKPEALIALAQFINHTIVIDPKHLTQQLETIIKALKGDSKALQNLRQSSQKLGIPHTILAALVSQNMSDSTSREALKRKRKKLKDIFPNGAPPKQTTATSSNAMIDFFDSLENKGWGIAAQFRRNL